jgi:hypothetical protein
MKDPLRAPSNEWHSTSDWSNYCDMAENIRPGVDDDTCYEVDLLEANAAAMQSAIHTETGGAYGSGNCDRNGCFSRVGGPNSPAEYADAYGPGKTIDSSRPFRVVASVDDAGALTTRLLQQTGTNTRAVISFDRQMAGNPQGSGVPDAALAAVGSTRTDPGLTSHAAHHSPAPKTVPKADLRPHTFPLLFIDLRQNASTQPTLTHSSAHGVSVSVRVGAHVYVSRSERRWANSPSSSLCGKLTLGGSMGHATRRATSGPHTYV